ncbi:ribonuclease inhibitor [Leminorella grimontii]|uniref:Ribonuclease inhibitor n=1 Tax=Leminorella grimontii TaxID=82981 RepID=A0AAV5N6H6_9GAMM|nr:barstar family protein [Leminorella grimontii]KFC94740.1 putative ribonuclease inhibitor [Leminorella grimontii ATCC 33999 = DSM 5078]GKX56483.1 ribonuclease inhibitor [Leminorella grimontii]GKX59916.1 ribonuclease inhibitor [Leminorella grimontii]VFS61413.1 Barstar (barnase inhibitor) [Leminorella grimontii]
MRSVVFDFAKIGSMPDFYLQFVDTFLLPDWFGNNLDALWDALTVGINLPVQIVFTHFDRQALDFLPLYRLFEQAQQELDGLLLFNSQ